MEYRTLGPGIKLWIQNGGSRGKAMEYRTLDCGPGIKLWIQNGGSRGKAMEYRTLDCGPGVKLWNTERWVPG